MIGEIKYGPYSPSRLDTARCPYSFYRQYLDPERPQERGPGSLAQERGSALHEILEKITQQMCRKETEFTGQQLREWTAEAIQKYPAAYEESGEILEMAKLYIRKPPKMLTEDAQTELRFGLKWDRNKFVECGYFSPDAFARGRADIFMVSDDLTIGYIIDHKTQPNIEEASTFQMGFYAWVTSKIHPYLKEIRTVLHFSRYGCYSEEYTWTKDMLEAVEDDILTRIMIVEGIQEWVAVPNDHCQYCDFIAECPRMGKYVQKTEQGYVKSVDNSSLKILGDTQKAVEVAGLVHLIEEFSGIAKKELRQYVKKSGPVAIPGRVFEYRPKEAINWEKANKACRDAVYEVFAKHKIDVRQFMAFSQKATSPVWLIENRKLIEELSKVLPRKVSSEFGAHKI